ncbi:hypothetical protein CP520_02290 [Mesoplasma lactucae ATCC 49193]|uniref:Uncharacterized protein n=1 Tax=Mesoplasma lactucae ATCC 49193 TaxID=81460 RepID=A0A291IRU0_9MOLU|nr:hypothetical protein CP520_02290 [Mesoplasma lactucae ATCC 49193]
MYQQQLINNESHDSEIKVKNFDASSLGVLVAPNFLFINKPNKTDKKETYKMIVWFEMIANHNQIQWDKLPRLINLKNFRFELYKRDKKTNQNIKIPYSSKNEGRALIDNLTLKYDQNNRRIDLTEKDFLEFKIPSELIDDEENNFLFSLDYQAKETFGISNHQQIGENRGMISFNPNLNKQNNKNFELDQVGCYLNRDSYNGNKHQYYSLLKKNYTFSFENIKTRYQLNEKLGSVNVGTSSSNPIFLENISYLKNILWDLKNNIINDDVVLMNAKIDGDKIKDYYNFSDFDLNLNKDGSINFKTGFDYDLNTNKIVKKGQNQVVFTNSIKNQQIALNLLLGGKKHELRLDIVNSEPSLEYQFSEELIEKIITLKRNDLPIKTEKLSFEEFQQRLKNLGYEKD